MQIEQLRIFEIDNPHQVSSVEVHAQVLITSWVVIALLIALPVVATRNLQTIPTGLQNFIEYVLEFIRVLIRTQMGEEEYRPWVPFIGTMFLSIFVSNWSGALLPWRVIQLPHGELAAPTNDINTTVALALLTSVAYFYAGLHKRGFSYHLLVVAVLVSLVPLIVPVPMMLLGLFTSAIQALISATLAATYIGESMEGHH
ncbi:hypothetical protein KP509_1Z023100 [Ceratopteris richardii]|nr:hypothetical protein KP509_1Z023100 [Ceratopteris richardii]